jgi:hypothetical protein
MNQHRLLNFRKRIILVTVAITVTTYYLYDPVAYSLGPACIFRATTGWLCWGCGGQRAFHQLLHGRFQEAFQLNALVYPVMLIMTYVTLSELITVKPVYAFFRLKLVAISAFVLLITFTVLRNI